MKYRIIEEDDSTFNVLVEDGGVACIRFVDESDIMVDGKMRVATTDYYQSRITDETTWDEVWENLAEGKMYYNDWNEDKANMDFMVKDALNWLVAIDKVEWTIDDTLFNNIK